MIEGNVHSIESMGTVDGPGVRFVVFMQGCPMRCKYCHNPDTWSIDKNQGMSVEKIYKQFESKKEFYKSGGITVTGGEPLLQIDFIIELFKKFKEKNIHTCVDTSGITFNSQNIDKFDELMKFTDLILLDIKHINPVKHLDLTSQKIDNIIEFARYLDNKHIDVIIRHVIVPSITYIQEYLYELGEFIGTLNNVVGLDVLPYHSMGIVKYQNMGIKYPLMGIKDLTNDDAKQAKQIILKGIRATRNSLKNGNKL
jgi:pyruvate formate lyase activating enzyme